MVTIARTFGKWIAENWKAVRQESPVIWGITKRIWVIYRPFLWPIVALIVLSLMQMGCFLSIPVFAKRLIEALYREAPVSEVVWNLFLMIGAFSILGPIQLLQDINRNTNIDIKNHWHLSTLTLGRLLNFSLRQIASGNSSLRQATIGKGEYAVHEVVRTFVKEFAPPLVKIAITICMFLGFTHHMGYVLFPVLTVYAILSVGLDIYIFPRLRECEDLDEKVDAEHAELLTHLELVVLSGEESRSLDEFNRRYAEFQATEQRLWVHYYTLSARLREPVAALGFGLVMITTVYFILTGVAKPADIAMSASWAVSLFTGLSAFPPMQRKFMRRYSLVRRYFEMLDQPPETQSPANSIRKDRLEGSIVLEDIHYSHRAVDGNGGDVPAVLGVSLEIGRGETIGIVGHTGSGKSTLVKALLRWYDPDTGVVRVDGVNLQQYDVKWYRNQIGYVPQHVHLFDTTIRRNISMGARRDLSDAELDSLSRLTGFDRFYARLGSKKFDITVGELGRHLSGGQIQLIGIMRALAKNPSVLIFDEATASLDYASEAIVQDAMRTALHGRTGIVIAHRLSTVRHLDRIVVMHEGRVVGVGTHRELLISCPEYANLVKHELRE